MSKQIIRFEKHPQSELPVIQVYREDEFGNGAWCWVRTPADLMDLSVEEMREIWKLSDHPGHWLDQIESGDDPRGSMPRPF